MCVASFNATNKRNTAPAGCCIADDSIVAQLCLDDNRYPGHPILHPRQMIVRMRMAVVVEAAGFLPHSNRGLPWDCTKRQTDASGSFDFWALLGEAIKLPVDSDEHLLP